MSKCCAESRLPKNSMTLTGQGQVSASPDLAVVHLGVQTAGYDLTAMQRENARKIEAVIQALQGIDVSDINTLQYSIDKNFIYENGNQIDRGYTITNILEVRTDRIDKVGMVIDTAVSVGANRVELIVFDLSDRGYYYRQALNLALDDAQQKARSISRNLGRQADPIPIRIIEDNAFPIQPLQLQREAVGTPIMPGDLLIKASVTAEFLY